jgi:hypothetical protein
MGKTDVFEAGAYTDKEGREWRRGLDGWFNVWPDGTIYLIPHDDMRAVIEEENPDE